MRLLGTILAALSLLLLLGVVFLWVRSYRTYDGAMRFTLRSTPIPVTVIDATRPGAPRSAQTDVDSRLRGVISYKGQLTYVSIADPRPLFVMLTMTMPDAWESWSLATNQNVEGPPAIVAPARVHQGITFGSALHDGIVDPNLRFTWKLPYSYVTCPHWMLALLLAFPPYFWLSNYRLLAKREREGRCLKCGTPLNGATPCANCGTPNA